MSYLVGALRDRRNALVIVSGSLLGALLAFDTTAQGIAAAAITLPAAFFCYAYLCRTLGYAQTYFRFQNSFAGYFAAVCSLYTLYLISNMVYSSGLGTVLRGQVLAGSPAAMMAGTGVLSGVLLPAVYAFFNWITHAIGRLLLTAFRQTDRYEKVVSALFLGTVLILLIVAYSRTSVFSNCFYIDGGGNLAYRSVDTLLDTDSPYVLRGMFDLTYINARHIFAKVLLLPVTIPAKLLSLPFHAREQAFALILCFAASVQLLLAALMVSRLSKERFLLPLLLCSYPLLFFSLVFERNQLALFLLVLAVYLNIGEERARHGDPARLSSIGLATGATTTSALVGLFVIRGKSLREYLHKGLQAAAMTLGMIFLTGKAKLFWSLDFAVESFFRHSDAAIGILYRLMHYTESVQSMLVPSKVYVATITEYDGTQIQALYNTVNRMEYSLSILGVIVIALALVGFFTNRKAPFAQVCLGWCCLHILIFPVLGFSATTYLLHAVMFSWAYLALAYYGLLRCLRFVPDRIMRYVRYALPAALLVINIAFLYHLYCFGIANYPVIAG